MQNRSLFLFAAVLCVVYITVSVDCGGDMGQWKEKMANCDGEKINVEVAFKGKEECKAEMKKASGEENMERRRRSPEGGKHSKGKRGGKGKGKRLVGAVCVWKKQGVLTSDGQFDEAGAKAHVDAVYPESKREEAFNKMKTCADEKSSTFSMDNNCAGYGDFGKCVWKSHMDLCKIEMPQWGKGKGKGGKKPKPQEEEDQDME